MFSTIMSVSCIIALILSWIVIVYAIYYLIFKRCWNHNWEIIERTYAPSHNVTLTRAQGRLSLYDGSGPDPITTTDRVLHGCTTLLLQCSNCKKLHREEMLGQTNFFKR